MPVNRGLVGVLALAVLVWGVAFGGGLTVAVLTSSANVTTTFETVDELASIDQPSGDDLTAATGSDGNGTNGTAPSGNGTAPSGNGTAPSGNGTEPSATPPPSEPVTNGSSPPQNETEPSASSGNASSEPSASSGNESSEPSDAVAPETNESASTGNTTAGSTPALRAGPSWRATGEA